MAYEPRSSPPRGGALGGTVRATLALVVLGVLSGTAAEGCREPSGPKPAAAPAPIDADAVVDPGSPIVLAIRPTALRRDEVWGTLVQTLSRLAAARGVIGTRELEAFESADEVHIAVDDAPSSSDVLDVGAGVAVLRGVRADLVPEKMLDGDGKLLFKSGRARGDVTEHEGYADDPVSLFVLPKRTWVVASGRAVSRARAIFADARPRRGRLDLDPEALLELRMDGASLVRRVPRLERGELAIGRRLVDARIMLRPGRGGVMLLLRYADVDAAAWAENTATRVVSAFARRLEGPLAWLGQATVVREGTVVRLRAEAPASFVAALKNIDVAELLGGAPLPPKQDAGAAPVP